MITLLRESHEAARCTPCSTIASYRTGKAAQAQLSSVDPVYVDAMELARYLIDHGFIVNCVQGSKMQHLFDGQKGAALYRTDRGSFEALFLSKTETFEATMRPVKRIVWWTTIPMPDEFSAESERTQSPQKADFVIPESIPRSESQRITFNGVGQ